jgi:lysozyme family protein
VSRSFDAAMEIVLKHEVGSAKDGGFTNDPDDEGGATKWGISLRYLRGLEKEDGKKGPPGDLDGDGDVDAADIKKMTREQAIEFYRGYWREAGMPTVEKAVQSVPVVIKIFDTGVNTGPKTAIKILQRALRACSGLDIADDGVAGKETLAAADAALPGSILAAYRAEQAGYYRELVARKATRQKFLKGWLNRAYS